MSVGKAGIFLQEVPVLFFHRTVIYFINNCSVYCVVKIIDFITSSMPNVI